MPDLLAVLEKWWKLIVGLTLLCVLIALIIALLLPKQYLSTVTALPGNSVTADKGRIFNNNIEGLYSEFGSVDELDKIEGTAALDTIYIATVYELNLVNYYRIPPADEDLHKAVSRLRKNSEIQRTPYGELKIKAWDSNAEMAASISNTLFENLQQLYQDLQTQNSRAVLEKINREYQQKLRQYSSSNDSLMQLGVQPEVLNARKAAMANQLQQYEQIVDQYDIAVKTSPPVLLAVERARPAVSPDRPKVLQTVLFTFIAAFVFSFLIALLLANRNRLA